MAKTKQKNCQINLSILSKYVVKKRNLSKTKTVGLYEVRILNLSYGKNVIFEKNNNLGVKLL